MPAIVDQSVYLELNGVSLSVRGAWRMLGVQRLYGFATRGENRTEADQPGDEAYPLELAGLHTQHALNVYGWRDGQSGARNADPVAGVVANMNYLRASLQPDGVTPTWAATLHSPDGDAAGDIQVVSLEFGDQSGPTVIGVLELIVPSGGFEIGGS